jgi:hypothetical protein
VILPGCGLYDLPDDIADKIDSPSPSIEVLPQSLNKRRQKNRETGYFA